MAAYSFRPQFAPAIIAGTKGGTIRAPRRASIRWLPLPASPDPEPGR